MWICIIKLSVGTTPHFLPSHNSTGYFFSFPFPNRFLPGGQKLAKFAIREIFIIVHQTVTELPNVLRTLHVGKTKSDSVGYYKRCIRVLNPRVLKIRVRVRVRQNVDSRATRVRVSSHNISGYSYPCVRVNDFMRSATVSTVSLKNIANIQQKFNTIPKNLDTYSR